MKDIKKIAVKIDLYIFLCKTLNPFEGLSIDPGVTVFKIKNLKIRLILAQDYYKLCNVHVVLEKKIYIHFPKIFLTKFELLSELKN